MNKLMLLSAFCLMIMSCKSTIDGEGSASAEKYYTVQDIKDLKVSCNCKVTIVPGQSNNVKVESHENIISNLKVESKNGKLSISENKTVGDFSAYDVFVYVTRDLKYITLENQTTIGTSGTLGVDDLNLKASDQTKVENFTLFTNNLKLTLDDQSNVLLKGTSISLVYKGSNQSNGNLFDFETNDAQVYTSDNAILEINSRKSLAGSAKGSSIVTYAGDPRNDIRFTDNAKVLKK